MKMETPKMDVVRFQEADIIVASGIVEHKNADVMNFGVGTTTDAYINYHNGHSVKKSISDLANDIAFGYADSGVTFTNGNNKTVTLGDLVGGNDAAGLYDDMNGYYETNNNGRSWTWIAGQ